jgi:hypothetical protein
VNAPVEPVEEPLHPAVAAARALPPMTDEECEAVGRIFAAIERRRQQQAAEQTSEVA